MQKRVQNTYSEGGLLVVASPSITPRIEEMSAARLTTNRRVELHVNSKDLSRLLNDLVPFYGPDCPAALFEVQGRVEIEAIRGSIATARDWVMAPFEDRPLVLMLG